VSAPHLTWQSAKALKATDVADEAIEALRVVIAPLHHLGVDA